MDTRFAGSHRLGERRRRRLAVESDDSAESLPSLEPLPGATGTRRTAHRAEAAPEAAAVRLPLNGIVPVALWKYVAGAVAALAMTAGILAAGWRISLASPAAGPALVRLCSLEDGSLAQWYSGSLLILSAQLSVLIWWGRSTSLKDFDGRYRIWIRTSGVWLFVSLCAMTGIHHVWSEFALQFSPSSSSRLALLTWLGPAAFLGLILLVTLNREMSGCRTSRALLFVAAGWYSIAAGLELRISIPVPSQALEVLRAGSPLLGHCSLFLCLWLHARHVLHCTPDPSRAPRRRLRIPRPHFRAPKLSFRWPRLPLQSKVSEPKSRSSDRKPRSRKAAPVADSEPTRPFEPEPVGEHEPLTLPPRREPPAPPAAPPLPVAAPPAPVTAPPQAESDDAESQDHDSGDWNEPFPKPDMRGLSKKQRRKLMQELREKERAARRP